jgi:hypothetical protein
MNDPLPTDPNNVNKIYFSDFKRNRVGRKNLSATTKKIEELIDIENGAGNTNNPYNEVAEDFDLTPTKLRKLLTEN